MASKKTATTKKSVVKKSVTKKSVAKTTGPETEVKAMRDLLFAWLYISSSQSFNIAKAKTPGALTKVTASILKTLGNHVELNPPFTKEITDLISAVQVNSKVFTNVYPFLTSFGARKWSGHGHHPRIKELISSFSK